MHHLVAYEESQDSAVLVNVAGLADESINVQGDNIRVPRVFRNVGAVYGLGVNITQARLLAPSLRDLVNLDISPLDVSAEPTARAPFLNLFDFPTLLVPGENLRFQAAEDGVGLQISNGAVWLVDGPQTPVTGEIATVRVTAAITQVAEAWTAVPLTFDQELPSGTYQLVGARMIGATAKLCRFIIPGVAHRPGMIAYNAVGDAEDQVFRLGRLGVWAEFDNVQSLQAEIFAVAADAAQEGFLDIIKIS